MDDIRQATTLLLLEIRAQYLASGANPLRHWDQIQDRMRAAARTTATCREWMTKLQHDLQIASPHKATCSRMYDLDLLVGARHDEFLGLVEREYAYLIAMTRLAAETRAAARLARKEKGHGTEAA